MFLGATNRQKIAKVAQRVLDGSIGIIAAAREIHSLCCGQVGLDERDPDLNTFVGIDSETDALPVGEVRKHWAPDALAKKDIEIARREAMYRDSALEAAAHLVARFTLPYCPSMTNEEIIEAERRITGIKSDLTIIAGANNAEEIAKLVLEKMPGILASLGQLWRDSPAMFESVEELSRVQNGMAILIAFAEARERLKYRPEYDKKLINAIMLLRIGCGLDKVAQNLSAVKLQQGT